MILMVLDNVKTEYPCNGKKVSLVNKSESAAFCIIFMWCMLPVVKSLYDIITTLMGLRDDCPADEMHAGGHYFGKAVDFYYSCFCILGIITILFAITTVLLSIKRGLSKKNRTRAPWFYILLMLLLWSVVCSLASEDQFHAFYGEDYLHDGLSSYFIYASIFVCASMIRKDKQRRAILRAFCAVVSYLSCLMILQHLIGGKMDYMFPDFHAVVFNQFNHFGYILCMSVIGYLGLFLYDSESSRLSHALYILGFCLSVYALLVNDTFGAYLASLAALPVVYCLYICSKHKTSINSFLPLFLFIALSLASIAGVLPFAESLGTNANVLFTDVNNIAIGSKEAAHAGTGRYTLWKDTVQRIKEHPVFGVGPEGLYGDNAITNNDSPHNEYLQIAAFLGIPGLMLYFSALFTLAVHHIKKLRSLSSMVLAVSGVTVVYLFSACFGNPVFNTYPFFWIFLGLTTAVSEEEYPVISLVDTDIGSVKTMPPAKSLAVLLGIAIIVLASLSITYYRIEKEAELHREEADLQLMRAAMMLAKTQMSTEDIIDTEIYWVEVDGFEPKLISGSEEKPPAYGMGKVLKGDGINSFKKETGMSFDYDESLNYTDKLLKVTINPVKEEEPQITLKWVESS